MPSSIARAVALAIELYALSYSAVGLARPPSHSTVGSTETKTPSSTPPQGTSCTAWLPVGTGRGRYEVRACATSQADDSAAPTTVEVRAAWSKPKKVRFEVLTADGTKEAFEVKAKHGVTRAGTCTACVEHGEIQSARLPEGTEASTTEAGVRAIPTGPHIQVLARDLRLADEQAGKLTRIAERFHRATRRKLIVTGGTRPPERQAGLMYEKLAHGEDILALYENQKAAAEILAVYREGVQRHLARKRLVTAIREKISQQIAEGSFISKHLRLGAIDVRSRGLSASEVNALKAAITAEPGVVLQDERSGTEPHFHVNL